MVDFKSPIPVLYRIISSKAFSELLTVAVTFFHITKAVQDISFHTSHNLTWYTSLTLFGVFPSSVDDVLGPGPEPFSPSDSLLDAPEFVAGECWNSMPIFTSSNSGDPCATKESADGSLGEFSTSPLPSTADWCLLLEPEEDVAPSASPGTVGAPPLLPDSFRGLPRFLLGAVSAEPNKGLLEVADEAEGIGMLRL